MKLKYLGMATAEGISGVFCKCETCKKTLAPGDRHIRTGSQAVIDDALLIDLPADTYLHYPQHRFPLYSAKQYLITHFHPEYEGHLTLDRCAALRKELICAGAANTQTKFIPNRFSHNAKHISYDKFVPIATEHGFKISRDGMTAEV